LLVTAADVTANGDRFDSYPNQRSVESTVARQDHDIIFSSESATSAFLHNQRGKGAGRRNINKSTIFVLPI